MKNIWKWVLGSILVLVVVGALAAIPFVWHNSMATNARNPMAPEANPQAPWNGGPLRSGYADPRGQPPGRFDGRRMPMMDNGRSFQRGFVPFGPSFFFLGGLLRLIPLAFFGLLLYGAYQLGKRAGMRSAQAAAASVEAPAG